MRIRVCIARLAVPVLAAAILLFVAAKSSMVVKAQQAPAAAMEVKIDNFSFGPDVTIATGSTVTWTNHDDVPHVVASDTNIFKSAFALSRGANPGAIVR